MTEPPPNSARESIGSLARDVLVLVLAGAALGIAQNALMQKGDPLRALPWFARERTVVRLEDVPPAPPLVRDSLAAQDGEAGSASPPASGKPARVNVGRPSSERRPSGERGPSPATGRATGRPSESGGPKSAPPTPVTTSPSTPADQAPAAAADVPAIPESREPMEAPLGTVRKLYAAHAALFVDARSAEEFAEGHIAGAVNVPFEDVFKNPGLLKGLETAGRPLVTYCGGSDCDLSRSLAFALIDGGFRRVVVFTGGLPEWKSAGGDVRTGAQP
jgi:rhodanese-related sulfurtransferase